MGRFLKSAYIQPIFLAILVVITLVILVSPLRRYIYLGYQNLGLKIGLNFNNIAKENYIEWIKSQSGELEDSQKAVFLNSKVQFRDAVASKILGSKTSQKDEKWIEVDLSQQRLYMKEGNRTVASFLVSTGKWAPTPVGQWRIWVKLRYTRMRGGSKALGTYYDLPNVPYTMYYYKGYGIHGAYWHNNFGHPMSHGCINMRPEEAGIVYRWASPQGSTGVIYPSSSNLGTRVVVHQ